MTVCGLCEGLCVCLERTLVGDGVACVSVCVCLERTSVGVFVWLVCLERI